MAVLLGDYGEQVSEVQPRRGVRFTHKELRRLTGGTRLQILRGGPRAEVEVIGWKLDPAMNENVAVDVVLCREAELPGPATRWWWPFSIVARPAVAASAEVATVALSLL